MLVATWRMRASSVMTMPLTHLPTPFGVTESARIGTRRRSHQNEGIREYRALSILPGYLAGWWLCAGCSARAFAEQHHPDGRKQDQHGQPWAVMLHIVEVVGQ